MRFTNIISIWNKEKLPEEWKESVTVHIYKKGDKTDCSNSRGISLLPTTSKILSNLLHMQMKLLGIINMECDTTGQLLIIYFAFVKYFRSNGNTVKQCDSS